MQRSWKKKMIPPLRGGGFSRHSGVYRPMTLFLPKINEGCQGQSRTKRLSSLTGAGSQSYYSPLPVEGEIFLLTFPFIDLRLPYALEQRIPSHSWTRRGPSQSPHAGDGHRHSCARDPHCTAERCSSDTASRWCGLLLGVKLRARRRGTRPAMVVRPESRIRITLGKRLRQFDIVSVNVIAEMNFAVVVGERCPVHNEYRNPLHEIHRDIVPTALHSLLHSLYCPIGIVP